MNKRKLFFGVLAGVLLLLLVLSEGTQQDPVNWSQSYHRADKIPLGAKVFYGLFQGASGEVVWEDVNIPAFEFFDRNPDEGTYFLFNREIYWNASTVDKLLHWVDAGNTVFISAFYPPDALLDTLGLEIDQPVSFGLEEKATYLKLVNPRLDSGVFMFDKTFPARFFADSVSTPMSVLGVSQVVSLDDEPEIKNANYIRVPVGAGQVLLHTFPPAFSNYFLLQEGNLSYVESLLAYLPKSGKLYYDNYYKEGKSFYSSPLYVIMNHRALRMAYYLLILLALVWVFFGGKRKQKAIPVIPPLKNQSLAFTETLAGVYLSKKAHKEVAAHQISYLLEYLRKRCHLLGVDISGSEWIHKVSDKYERKPATVTDDFEFIDKLRSAEKVTEDQLQKLNQLVTFYTEKHDGKGRKLAG